MLSYEDNVRAILESNFAETKEEFVEIAVRQIMRLSIPKYERLELLPPIPVCKYRLPCGNCDYLDMPCPVICEPPKGDSDHEHA